MYQNGWGVPQDYSQAREWYLKAANQGNMQAQASMGLLYYKGWGVAQNYDTALEWYAKAAAQGYEVAKKRIESITLLKEVKPFIQKAESEGLLPLPGLIADNKVNVRNNPNMKAKVLKKLNSGHPVSIYRTSETDSEFWYYIKTASGTEGWVLASYVGFGNVSRTDQEKGNRRFSLPHRGYVANIVTPGDKLNVRNIPSLNASKINGRLENGNEVRVLEIFAENERDWYRIHYEGMVYIPEQETDYDVEIEGWVNGRYIDIR